MSRVDALGQVLPAYVALYAPPLLRGSPPASARVRLCRAVLPQADESVRLQLEPASGTRPGRRACLALPRTALRTDLPTKFRTYNFLSADAQTHAHGACNAPPPIHISGPLRPRSARSRYDAEGKLKETGRSGGRQVAGGAAWCWTGAGQWTAVVLGASRAVLCGAGYRWLPSLASGAIARSVERDATCLPGSMRKRPRRPHALHPDPSAPSVTHPGPARNDDSAQALEAAFVGATGRVLGLARARPGHRPQLVSPGA
ncbi:hypothetical protein K488DRAFT_86392 [Vararia minispora EC-137]|uniref:Uncharacterized protein n=1 Tax=Vararia minispora EC-137 TaxID=1314806 RepID=A0ACB8QJH6_9AGAM|nr:hypothetical protein K488DRAFT_86392 [Vararia minispora EC-137]